MSRIGVLPIDTPDSADVSIDNSAVHVSGPKGELSISVLSGTKVSREAGQILVSRRDDGSLAKERHGLMRTLIANAVRGVTEGFSKSLEINGVGFRAQVEGDVVVLHIGYSQPRRVKLPEGISASVEDNTLTISGADKQLVGQVAANIRSLRPPEPYKGKGISYSDEHVRRKAGKTAGAGK
ncbi:50S ribosomal protein L6 [Candidatus Saccharibacteria bacterium QS_8_54_8]|nr:MAG: 50S ribosomal protein L6 [Candidatus Saccharibacteria bacterium QS_8_54_8]